MFIVTTILPCGMVVNAVFISSVRPTSRSVTARLNNRKWARLRKLIRLQKTKTVKEFPIMITVVSIVMITLYTKANVDCISVSETKNSAAIMRYQYWQYCKSKKKVLVDYLTSTHRQSFADLEGQRKKQMFCSSNYKIFTVILRPAKQMFEYLL